ncbi:hypothetical protein [Paracoccus sediminis]|uniref:Uncharacterized protein n=1 Tax=Paracoccus sediminis TaxID=1214787 RepID=A0A238Y6A6_9RHOB|nr:hypothetical protein [Paracoccus sediminis]SNR66637.1 hypothetical protein SAMN06265378_11526 [Paracoccus sediminis]
MSLIKNVTNTWSDPVALATDEIWQARWGSVFLTTTANPDPKDGFSLEQGQGVLIGAGTQVRYRKEGRVDAVIVHEAV